MKNLWNKVVRWLDYFARIRTANELARAGHVDAAKRLMENI